MKMKFKGWGEAKRTGATLPKYKVSLNAFFTSLDLQPQQLLQIEYLSDNQNWSWLFWLIVFIES